jgi:hypothetical protein
MFAAADQMMIFHVETACGLLIKGRHLVADSFVQRHVEHNLWNSWFQLRHGLRPGPSFGRVGRTNSQVDASI